mmetsp:Transcript_70755/g.197891  ORF Transcript_70755/g.197891 Transcript_70755/m.197891 type:complete len:314 (-) Transcript_70755:147-1088(-)
MYAYGVCMMLIFPIGTPLAMLTMLAKYREHLNPVGVSESVVVQRRKNDPVLVEAPIVSFAIIFRPKWWWWECYNMVRRLMLTCMVALYDTLPSTTVFMVAVSIVTLVFEREAKPYIDPFLSVFTYLAAWQILLFILYCLLIDANFTDGSQSVIISSICMLTNVFLCLVVFFDTRDHVAKRKRQTAGMQAGVLDEGGFELNSVYSASDNGGGGKATQRVGDRGDGEAAEGSGMDRMGGGSVHNPMTTAQAGHGGGPTDSKPDLEDERAGGVLKESNSHHGGIHDGHYEDEPSSNGQGPEEGGGGERGLDPKDLV